MVNNKWLEIMPQSTITHLPTVSFDHCLLLLEMTARFDGAIKYFKILNFWVDQLGFMDTMEECWERPTSGNPIWVFDQKMKRLSTTLSSWSKTYFGDIHSKVKSYDERIKDVEKDLINQCSDAARTHLHSLGSEYIRFLKLEESILRQESQLHQFQEGDANIGYFHANFLGRRRWMFIHQMKDDDDIVEASYNHFQEIFTGEKKHINEDILNCIPALVNQNQNESLQAFPDLDELKQVVFSMSTHSAAGPDGINGKFFQTCWEIIKIDLLAVIYAFFYGQKIPKYFTHVCLMLFPKVKNPSRLSEFK